MKVQAVNPICKIVLGTLYSKKKATDFPILMLSASIKAPKK